MARQSEHKKALVALTKSVLDYENALDALMQAPDINVSPAEKGRKIARLTNSLSTANQVAMLHGLNYSWSKINRLYRVQKPEPKSKEE